VITYLTISRARDLTSALEVSHIMRYTNLRVLYFTFLFFYASLLLAPGLSLPSTCTPIPFSFLAAGTSFRSGPGRILALAENPVSGAVLIMEHDASGMASTVRHHELCSTFDKTIHV